MGRRSDRGYRVEERSCCQGTWRDPSGRLNFHISGKAPKCSLNPSAYSTLELADLGSNPSAALTLDQIPTALTLVSSSTNRKANDIWLPGLGAGERTSYSQDLSTVSRIW